MTEPFKDDRTPAVVLQEPQRERPATDWREGFTLQPEETGVLGLHPGWAAVLAEGEMPLWQGRPRPDPHRSVFSNLPAMFIVFVLLVLLLQSGAGAGLVPFLVLGYIAYRLTRGGKRRALVAADRIYLVTNREAYVGRVVGETLREVARRPITADLPVVQEARAVVFGEVLTPSGQPLGFYDIPDARQVHDLIRDLQKGKP